MRPSIGPDVNHPQFHLVFAQFCLIFLRDFSFDSEAVFSTFVRPFGPCDKDGQLFFYFM